MKRNLNLISFAAGKIARLCLLMWIFGIADHSCIAADGGKKPDDRGPVAGKSFVAGPGAVAAILPDIPQIDWRDLTQGRLIGRGGFGDVYEGQWKGQDVAIKKLHIHALPNTNVKRDFDAEVRVMWSSQYPRILRLYGVTDSSNCAMVMERMQRSLHDLIHSQEEIPDAKGLQIAIDIAQGLASLHGQKIVHRDLKSQNILLGRGDRGKISDFGLAKIRVHTQSTTKSGGMSGTVRWSAPEVFGVKPQTSPASDMYSYGMILWELLTRKVPFAQQPNDIMVLAAVMGGVREDIPEGCHPVWQEVILGCWEQDPGKRPAASDVLARFMSLKPPQRPQWLPEEDLRGPLRVEGYARQLAGQGDWNLVLRSYALRPVPGYDVGRVEVIFNPSMDKAFEGRRNQLQQRQGNPRYAASWRESRDAGARAEIARYLDALTDPWQDEDYPGVKLMPLWHGTQRDKLGSLLSAGYGPFGDTDDGYFGKGIYAAFEAAYAQKYADKFGPPDIGNGILIFNWGITYNSRPILKSDYNQALRRLIWSPDIARYDSHFVPVVPLTEVDYIPVTPPEPHQFTEVVFFDASQLLPRYLITLQPTLPNSPMMPMSQTYALLEAMKGQQRGEQAARDMAALKKQLEAAQRELTAAQQEKEQSEQEAGKRTGDLNKRLEDAQKAVATKTRETEQAGRDMAALKRKLEQSQSAEQQASQHIEELKRQLAVAQEEAGNLRSQALALPHVAPKPAAIALSAPVSAPVGNYTPSYGNQGYGGYNSPYQINTSAPVSGTFGNYAPSYGGSGSFSASPSQPSLAPERPSIPLVARGHEAIYERFLNGVLLYRPTKGSDVGMVTLPIKDMANPLEGTFDLSRCGDTGKYLSIATGYKKGTKPENKDKAEVWFAPRFLIEKELNGTAAHFKPIMGNWKQESPVGIFWTWWDDDLKYYDYLTTKSTDDLSKCHLYDNWGWAHAARRAQPWGRGARSSSRSHGAYFHVVFCP